MIRLSIIMATRNSARYLSEALASIGPSCGANIETEVLLADGGSSDETLTIAASYPGLRIISREDSGIYCGMNRALAAARGDYAIILNSDDLLLPSAIADALDVIEQAPDCSFVSGQALFGRDASNATVRSHAGALSLEGAMFGIPAINARIFRVDALRELGPIRTDLGLAADREWMARWVRNGRRGCALFAPLYLYRIHVGSHTISGDQTGKLRVYRAELELAEALIGREPTETNLRKLAHANRAFALLRLQWKDASAARFSDISLLDLSRGLMLAYRWRGKLSGF
ncbi:MAG: glycosyltransferase [Phreatobacter sp.]|uniref:glycosyltransferase n=1 Tax=Phreatobacter sp. TaxID=1966341 RepID=UPI001A52419B|nr:glycosyltransferase [Phreatobacter sp.]MBL8571949.1 glycosyltransferase [Phreatobacter sp.]